MDHPQLYACIQYVDIPYTSMSDDYNNGSYYSSYKLGTAYDNPGKLNSFGKKEYISFPISISFCYQTNKPRLKLFAKLAYSYSQALFYVWERGRRRCILRLREREAGGLTRLSFFLLFSDWLASLAIAIAWNKYSSS